MRVALVSALLLSSLAVTGCPENGSNPPAPPPGGPTTGPASHPLPIPTSAVDASLFPTNGPERYRNTGRTYHVSPAGNDGATGSEAAPLRTIRRALAVASAAGGNKVVVHAGTYAEGTDHRGLVIGRDDTIVVAAPGEKPIVRPAGSGVTYGLEIAASRVTWSGVSIEGFAANGVSIGVAGRTVRDVVLADLTVTMPRGSDGVAIYPAGTSTRPVVDGLLVERARIVGADLGFTVSSGPVRSVALVDAVVTNRGGDGSNSGSDAVAVESGDNVLVNGVEISGASADGIDLKATRVAVVSAHVHHVGRNGVKLWRGGDVVNSLVHDTGADAAIVLDADPAATTRYRLVNTTVAFHNRTSGASSYSMTVAYDDPRAAVDLEIAGTVFHGHTGPIVVSRGTRLTIRNSLLAPAPGGTVLEYAWDGGASRTIEASQGVAALSLAATASGNLPFGTNPRFADPDAKTLAGFRLETGSPLVDAGLASAPFPSVDLVRAARTQGARPDLGPLEAR